MKFSPHLLFLTCLFRIKDRKFINCIRTGGFHEYLGFSYSRTIILDASWDQRTICAHFLSIRNPCAQPSPLGYMVGSDVLARIRIPTVPLRWFWALIFFYAFGAFLFSTSLLYLYVYFCPRIYFFYVFDDEDDFLRLL